MVEQKQPIFAKSRIIFGLLLVALIIAGELVLHFNHWATWPAFACMILYFLAHMDPKQIPHIIIGSFFGILNYPVLVAFVKTAAPTIGAYPAQLLYIAVFVAAIILLKDHVSWVFNTNAFMLLVMSGIAGRIPPGPEPVTWMGIQLVIGTALVLGVYGIQKTVAAIMAASQKA